MSLNIKKWRQEHGMTQKQMADACGVYIITYGRYERGEAVRESTHKLIERRFKELQQNNESTKTTENYKPQYMSVDDLWKFLPDGIKYVAKDESGEIYGFKDEPRYNHSKGEWQCSLGCVNIPLNIDFRNVESENSLIKRPYNFYDYIGKYGVFFDRDENTLVFGKLTEITQAGYFVREGCTFSYNNFRPLTDEEKGNLV